MREFMQERTSLELATEAVDNGGRPQIPERVILETPIENIGWLMDGTLRLVRRVEPIGGHGKPVYTTEWELPYWQPSDEFPDGPISVTEHHTLAAALSKFSEMVQEDETWLFASDLAEATLPGFHEQVEEKEKAEREARWAEEGELPF